MSLTGNNGLLAAAGANQPAYSIDQSVVLDTNSYFTRTPSSAGNRKTWTWSGWVKRGNLETNNVLFSSADSSVRQWFGFYNNNLWFDHTNGSYVQSDALYRDVGGWYHIVVAWDTTQSTDTNRIKIYVNGEQISLTVNAWPALNQDGEINNTSAFTVGNLGTYSGYCLDGYLAEVHFIDGQALTPASFGETNADTNQWVPIKYTGSYGTNGFYLDFATRATDPIDASGNGNNLSSTNVIAGDWKIDSPTNNFATMNPSDTFHAGSSTFAEGNLKVSEVGGNAQYTQVGNFGMSSGKWYFEFCGVNSDNTWMLGVADVTKGLSRGYTGTAGDGLFVYVDGDKYAPTVSSSYGVSWTHSDVMGVAVDMDNNAMYFAKNNTWMNSGVPTSGSTKTGAAYTTELVGKTWVAAMGRGSTANTITGTFNFGQDSSFAGAKTAQGNGGVGEDFYYTPPTGYKALNTDNLDDPSIVLPTDYFNTVLYTGTGSEQAITGVGFQPDFSWHKTRATQTYNHRVFDVVRGVTKEIYPTVANAEVTDDAQTLKSFDSDGVTLGTSSGVNQSGVTFASWHWKARGGTAPTKTFAVTVTNPGSGNRYTLDGKVSGTNAMPITIEEGGTYTFDQSDNSNSGHPLRFSTTANGTHGGGSEYTTGVTVSGTPGNAGAKTVITVAASAATLYFYCTAHSGMGAQASTPGSGGGVSDLSGTIASVVNANTTAGFSIVSYTGNSTAGATVGHGLSQAPDLVIAKERTNVDAWLVFSEPLGNTKALFLNEDVTAGTHTTYWNDTSPSSTVVTLGSDNKGNGSGTIIMYCFHSIDGYSQVGKYTGNGATDGPFVYTGFRPAFIMVKLTTASSGQWVMFDNKRDPDNPTDRVFYANLNAISTDVSSYSPYDLLSNGFKSRIPAGNGNEASYNTSGQEYIYLAFAESPLKYANAR